MPYRRHRDCGETLGHGAVANPGNDRANGERQQARCGNGEEHERKGVVATPVAAVIVLPIRSRDDEEEE